MTMVHKKKTQEKVTLKTIAEHLGLTPGTVFSSIEQSAAARSIPEHTKQRILDAAREFNYRPNFFAPPSGFSALLLSGNRIGDWRRLRLASHQRHRTIPPKAQLLFLDGRPSARPNLLPAIRNSFFPRRGRIITVDTSVTEAPPIPTVAVAGHQPVAGVTNIVLDHKKAVRMALEHLKDLGHREIAFLKANPLARTLLAAGGHLRSIRNWESAFARNSRCKLKAPTRRRLSAIQLEKNSWNEVKPFTALFALQRHLGHWLNLRRFASRFSRARRYFRRGF